MGGSAECFLRSGGTYVQTNESGAGLDVYFEYATMARWVSLTDVESVRDFGGLIGLFLSVGEDLESELRDLIANIGDS